jgi:hypothetical protein
MPDAKGTHRQASIQLGGVTQGLVPTTIRAFVLRHPHYCPDALGAKVQMARIKPGNNRFFKGY